MWCFDFRVPSAEAETDPSVSAPNTLSLGRTSGDAFQLLHMYEIGRFFLRGCLASLPDLGTGVRRFRNSVSLSALLHR